MRAKDGSGVIRVLVCAASAIRREGLESVVGSDPSLTLVGSVAAVGALRSSVAGLQPDIILADLDEPDSELLAAASGLEAQAVVTLIDEPNANWAAHALRAGVRAILPRDSGEEEIRRAIDVAHRGLVLLGPEVTRELARRVPSGTSPVAADLVEDLTPREIEVLRMLAEGFGNKEIALRLAISEHTVKFHISSILDKLDASTRTEAVTLGVRMGLILL